jgi:hypothetical protein
MAYLLNNVAFENYDCCSVTETAARLRRTARGLRTTLAKLERKGYVTIQGTAKERVIPTAKALRQQDETLSEEEAKRILKRMARGRK